VVLTIAFLVMVISVYPQDKNGGFDLSAADLIWSVANLIWAAADSQFLIYGVGKSEY
jgi:hypothetical protein